VARVGVEQQEWTEIDIEEEARGLSLEGIF
jgi:hypothetical protein